MIIKIWQEYYRPQNQCSHYEKINFWKFLKNFYSRAISYSEPLMLELSSPTSFIELKCPVSLSLKVILGQLRSSEVIKGHPRLSEGIRG